MLVKRTTAAFCPGLAVIVMLLISGCGGSAASSRQSSTSAKDVNEASHLRALSFTNDKRAATYVTFGREGSEVEREEASKVLTENLEARQKGDFVTQCATLSPLAVESVINPEGIPKVKSELGPRACPRKLKALATPLSKSTAIRVNTLDGPIDAFRTDGKKAYALYHGTGGKDYAIEMEKIHGGWRVGALLTVQLN
jgi:hypothetical protein